MQVAAGGFHFLVLQEGGDLYAWGTNKYGQVGNGTTVDQPTPVRVMRGICAVEAGWNHSIAVRRDGECFAWGCNSGGQLGDGTQIDRHKPTQVLNGQDPLWRVLGVSAGMDHSLAIVVEPGKAKRLLFAWGANVSGLQACDDSPAVTSSTLTGLSQFALHPVVLAEDVLTMSAGMTHTLAILTNGDCMAWGRNTNGQLGDGSKVNRLKPVKVLEKVREVSAGVDYSIAVLASGECFAWGCNRGGRLGDGSQLDRLSPIKILDEVQTVSAGHGHCFAVTFNQETYGWGRNMHHCLCSHGDPMLLTPMLLTADITAIAAGGCHTLGVTSHGEFRVWGRDWHGQLDALKAFAKPVDLFQGPRRGMYETLRETGFRKKSGLLCLGPGLTTKSLLAINGQAAAAALEGDDDGSDEGDLPPPENNFEEKRDETPPPEEEAVVEEEAIQEEGEPDWAALLAAWRLRPSEEYGDDIHRRIHAKARQTGRCYLLAWKRHSSTVLYKPYEDTGGEPTDPEQEEVVLRLFQASLVERAHAFREDDCGFGGAIQRGWSAEECAPVSGVLGLEAELKKASKGVTDKPSLFLSDPPAKPRRKPSKLPRPKKTS